MGALVSPAAADTGEMWSYGSRSVHTGRRPVCV